MVNSTLLKEKMSADGITQEYLAEKLKIAQSSLALKINNSRSFTIEEMFKIVDLFDLSLSAMREIFLNQTCETQEREEETDARID